MKKTYSNRGTVELHLLYIDSIVGEDLGPIYQVSNSNEDMLVIM